jgi:osmotically-inducible protein OsmY
VLQGMLATLLAGCAGSAKERSTGDVVDDTTINAKVKAALLNDPAVTGLAIQVETYKGAVQLSGFVKTAEERSRAASLARSVAGVQSVRNDIVVR